ncbi:uncharacterized protein LOC123304849 [Chrysoperla carnea]|uniref:uncharacterized protein LOC123304849 n=1 Tax=Chrysoperla carnea TaxID=189513 RepID=UPI001D065F64|nr:uncharacterized protein LOC123304849 [Chrysoperla carnea]
MKKVLLKRNREETGLSSHNSHHQPTSRRDDKPSSSNDGEFNLPSRYSHPSTSRRDDETESSADEEEFNHPSHTISQTTELWQTVTAFGKRVFTGALINLENSKKLKTFFKHKETLVRGKIMEYLSLHTLIKISLAIKCDFIIRKADAEVVDTFPFALKLSSFDHASDFKTWYNESLKKLEARLEDFQSRGGIEFPVKLKDIIKVEKNNDFSINVYGLSDSHIVNGPLYLTREKKEKHINLLMISDGTNFHYCLIRNLSRLCSSQISKHKTSHHICDRCLQYFYEERKYIEHLELCRSINNVKIVFPSEKDSKLKFKNYNRKLAVPFVIYSDFECILSKVDDDVNNISNTTYFQQHIAYSVAIQVVCSYDSSKNQFFAYRGENASKWFINKLRQIADVIEGIYKTKEPIRMTEEDEISFQLSSVCHICEKPFLENDIKVRDHCHLNSSTVNPLSNYRGSAHESCNLKFSLPNFIPVIFHNGCNYDFNLFIHELGYDEGEIKAIPINSERYISFSKEMNSLHVRFIDSCRFMQSSLDSLVKNFDETQFQILENEIGATHPHLELLKQKGIFPYDYITGWDKLEENSLPDKREFYNQLTDSNITDEEYAHAKDVWSKFNINNLGEYADLYLKCDVLLLSCVFENFREICLSTYQLDAAYYYTIPGLTFDAMLKVTQVELDLITDINILNFVENSIRGGLTVSVKRYAESNVPHSHDYNPNLPESYIVYLDANNLYGLAMSQPLPICDFKFLSPLEVQNFNINTDVNGEYGYFLEQALKYGLKLTARHRILRFRQSLWLKKYIDLNTEKRTNARNSFEKDFFKLMNNAMFGKTMESVRKRRKSSKRSFKPNSLYLRRGKFTLAGL